MTDEQLAALEAAARAATPGPWRFGDWSITFGSFENPENMRTLERNITQGGNPKPYRCTRPDGRTRVLRLDEPVEDAENAAYIAAADPSTMLQLIADLRAARRRAEIATDHLNVLL